MNIFQILILLQALLPETDKNLAAPIRIMWIKVPEWSRLFRFQMKLFACLAIKYPNLYIKMILKEFGETDREVYERLHLAAILRPDRNESYRQGGIGSWYDAMIPGNWPIPLNEINARVYLWQGEEDISVPLAMGQYMAEKIPNCEAEFIKGSGLFWIFEHLPEMLEKLVSGVDGKEL